VNMTAAANRKLYSWPIETNVWLRALHNRSDDDDESMERRSDLCNRFCKRMSGMSII
jgi:hypothetical protein